MLKDMYTAVVLAATSGTIFEAFKVNDLFNSESMGSSYLGDSMTLRQAAQGTGIYIGTAMNQRHMKNDKAYAAYGAKEYDLLTGENACKTIQIAKSYTKFDYSGCDYLADFAKKNGMAMRGHTLVWGSPPGHGGAHNPQFVIDEKDPAKLEKFMVDYIHQTLNHVTYPFAWDVVNEAINDGPNYIMKTSPWSIIDDYICKAFKAARDANPKVELFYNDYKHASMTGRYKSKSDKVYNLLKDLKQKGCPIDGVGFQSHIDINYDDENIDSIRKNIQRYAAIGLNVHFTEIDVRCNQFKPNECPYKNSWDEAGLQKQADIYQKLLLICLEEPNCYSFESWGFSDKYGPYREPQNPFPFDKNFNKKEAYTTLLSTLQNFDRNHPAVLARVKSETTQENESISFMQ